MFNGIVYLFFDGMLIYNREKIYFSFCSFYQLFSIFLVYLYMYVFIFNQENEEIKLKLVYFKVVIKMKF